MEIPGDLDEPYQGMYDQLAEETSEESVDADIKMIVQNALHESVNAPDQ